MANTADTTKNGLFIQVTYTGTGDDWDYTDTGFNRMKVKSIQWHPSAANDVLVINEEGIDGASIFHAKASADTDTKIKYFYGGGAWMKPYIDLTDCTFGTITSTKIIFEIV